MNCPSFTGSSTIEDPEIFVEELKKVFEVMYVPDTERVELAMYQLENVARTWFDKWKEGRAEDAPLATKAKGAAPSFASAHAPRNKSSVAQGGNYAPAGARYGRTHPGKSHDGQTSCFKCGQEGHFMEEGPKNRKGSGKQGNKAQSSSVDSPDRDAPRGATSGTCGGTNCLYAITSRHEQENSPDAVTDCRTLFVKFQIPNERVLEWKSSTTMPMSRFI
ncbi:uncharacterized protein LOC125845918 [Solanum stenotomum]|uniref:uncharacterized protein LOC125845918 n=1 Tax=Solanum stenotomum TaxID=172797 RepID=UPI0020D1F2CF|nr:uncharacterized protein LOC125845918 [Solanum stenotomum]